MHGLGVSKQTLLSMMPGIDPAAEKKLRQREDDDAASRQAQTMSMGGLPVGGPEASTTPLPVPNS
jgi:hypothetical protein